MRRLLALFVLWVLVGGFAPAQTSAPDAAAASPAGAPDAELDRIAAWMTGDFDTFSQVDEDEAAGRAYKHLRAVMHIAPHAIEGLTAPEVRTFYVEQAAAGAEATPYRQRVYALTRRDGVPVNRIYKIKQPERFVGGHADPAKLAALTLAEIDLEEGCDLVWTRMSDALYAGITGVGGTCRSTWRGGAYAVSQVQLTPWSVTSLDQGFDDRGEHKWGPKPGTIGHVFLKRGTADTALVDAFVQAHGGREGEALWALQGTLYRVAENGTYEPLQGVVGYRACAIAPAAGGDASLSVREVLALSDLKHKKLAADAAPVQGAFAVRLTARTAAEGAARITGAGEGDGRRLALGPYEIAGRDTERIEVEASAGRSSTLQIQRDTTWSGLGRVHLVLTGRPVGSLDVAAAASRALRELVDRQRATGSAGAAAPRRDN